MTLFFVRNRCNICRVSSQKELADEVSKDKPKKIKISNTKEGLIKAAENVANVVPTVLQISKQIADHILANPK